MQTINPKDLANQYIVLAMKNPFVLEKLLELRKYDKYTFTHSINVATEALCIGFTYDLTEQELLDLTYAAILHDIGKMKIDINIINKKSSLSKKEYELIKRHPINGALEVRNSKFFSKRVEDAIFMHHENVDGTGYYQVEPKDIPLFAKIIRVADTFDAMTDSRPYQNAKPESEVIQMMLYFKDLDPDIFRTFINNEIHGKNICTLLDDKEDLAY